ncbi:flagellar hook-length control protein FliK, partial [Bordetella pertussis]|uniref:flagellar hook-length control protein FliK n=1 Tax=Bordetella pertussis TaxID=520 RepID=UPI000A5D7627
PASPPGTRPARRCPASTRTPRCWCANSCLKLNLPRLGTVEARLNLAANQLVLHVVAPDSAAEIGAAADALRQQLSAAGLTLTNLSVDAVAAPGFALPEA